MATYNFTTTARQDTGLAFARTEINAERAERGQSALTLAQVFDFLAGRMLGGFADRSDEDDRRTLREAYINATPAQRASARAALGL